MAQALSNARVAILGDPILIKKLLFSNKFRQNHAAGMFRFSVGGQPTAMIGMATPVSRWLEDE
jgi:hypothetical protein